MLKIIIYPLYYSNRAWYPNTIEANWFPQVSQPQRWKPWFWETYFPYSFFLGTSRREFDFIKVHLSLKAFFVSSGNRGSVLPFCWKQLLFAINNLDEKKITVVYTRWIYAQAKVGKLRRDSATPVNKNPRKLSHIGHCMLLNCFPLMTNGRLPSRLSQILDSAVKKDDANIDCLLKIAYVTTFHFPG